MDEKKREIARALVQIAWADNELTPGEAELLSQFLRKIGFDEESAQQAWLTENQPVNYEALRRLLPDHAERLELMKELLTISFSDDHLTFDEFDVLDKMAQALEVSEEEVERLRTEINLA